LAAVAQPLCVLAADEVAAPAHEAGEPPLPRRHATIYLISGDGEHAELRALLAELLERQGIECKLDSAPRFDPEALMTEDGDDARVLVFLKLERERARLYFRGPGGTRFLLRRLELSRGLDELGSELIAQVVESSVLALLHSSAGLSRDQASAELAREETSAKGPTPTPRPSAPPRPRQAAPALRLGAGARYAASWGGAELGLAHGPGLELDLRHGSATFVRAHLSVERWFAQAFRAGAIEAEVQTFALRAGLAVALPLGSSQHLVSALGAGADIRRLEPLRATAGATTLAAADTSVLASLRGELRYELVLEPLRLTGGALLDVSLVDTHYDFVEDGERKRVVEPWPLRPGVLLGLGWDF
jgi:hypothetical protein